MTESKEAIAARTQEFVQACDRLSTITGEIKAALQQVNIDIREGNGWDPDKKLTELAAAGKMSLLGFHRNESSRSR